MFFFFPLSQHLDSCPPSAVACHASSLRAAETVGREVARRNASAWSQRPYVCPRAGACCVVGNTGGCKRRCGAVFHGGDGRRLWPRKLVSKQECADHDSADRE